MEHPGFLQKCSSLSPPELSYGIRTWVCAGGQVPGILIQNEIPEGGDAHSSLRTTALLRDQAGSSLGVFKSKNWVLIRVKLKPRGECGIGVLGWAPVTPSNSTTTPTLVTTRPWALKSQADPAESKSQTTCLSSIWLRSPPLSQAHAPPARVVASLVLTAAVFTPVPRSLLTGSPLRTQEGSLCPVIIPTPHIPPHSTGTFSVHFRTLSSLHPLKLYFP